MNLRFSLVNQILDPKADNLIIKSKAMIFTVHFEYHKCDFLNHVLESALNFKLQNEQADKKCTR